MISNVHAQGPSGDSKLLFKINLRIQRLTYYEH